MSLNKMLDETCHQQTIRKKLNQLISTSQQKTCYLLFCNSEHVAFVPAIYSANIFMTVLFPLVSAYTKDRSGEVVEKASRISPFSLILVLFKKYKNLA